jgi:hypothetical protein
MLVFEELMPLAPDAPDEEEESEYARKEREIGLSGDW